MSSRRYIKRVWRVPKTRGALDAFATLVCKALIKHGWPAMWQFVHATDGFVIYEQGRAGGDLPPDFQSAFEVAVRITARTHRLDVTQHGNWCGLNRQYLITPRGDFRESK